MPEHVCVHTPTAAGQGKNAVLGTVASTVLNPLSYSTTDLLKRIGRASITRAWIFHAAALSARMHAVGQALGAGRDAPRPIRGRAAAPRGTRLRPPVSFVKTLKYIRYIKYDTCPARVVMHTAPHKTRPPTHPRDASAARANARSCPAPAWCRARKRERRRGQRARARAHARFEPAAHGRGGQGGGGESGRQRVRRRWYLRRRKTRWVSRRQGNLVRLSGRPGSAVRMGSKGGGPWRLQPPWARRAWRAAACDSTRPFSAREGLWTPPSAGQLPWVVLGRGACSARGRGAAASRERLSRFESPCGGRRALRAGRGEGEGGEGGGGAWSGGEGGESAGSRSQGLEYRRFDGRRGFEKRDAVGAVAPTASAVSHRHQPPAARRARSCRRRASGSKAGGAGGWPGGVARGGAPSRSSRRLGAPCRPARGLASQGPDSGPKATF